MSDSLDPYLDPAPKSRRGNYDELINRHAQRTGLDPELVRAVVHQESGGNRRAVSPKGAQGLGQLMPATAKRFGVTDPFDPEQNIRGATDYLKFLNDRFKGNRDLVLAGYNAGEGAVDKFGGIPPYKETQNYVRSISARLGTQQSQQPQPDLDRYLDPSPSGQTPPASERQTLSRSPNPPTPPTQPPLSSVPSRSRQGGGIFGRREVQEAVRQGIRQPAPPSVEQALMNLGREVTASTEGLKRQAQSRQRDTGMVEQGNIDLANRPRVRNPDGSVSTVRSISVNVDGREVLIPTVSEDGRILPDQEAIQQYRQTGRHLGIFKSPQAATRYAKRLHEDQARQLDTMSPPTGAGDLRRATRGDEARTERLLQLQREETARSTGSRSLRYIGTTPGREPARAARIAAERLSAEERANERSPQQVEVELARQRRVSQTSTGEYLAQVPKSAALGLASAAETGLKSIGILARKLNLFNEYDKEQASDTTTYKAGEWIARNARKLLGSNPDLEQDFLVGQTPQAIGQAASFLLGGVATKAPRLATAILGAGMSAGSAYDEVRANGGTDDEAVNAGLLSGVILGPTELIGTRRLMKALSGTQVERRLQSALVQSLRDGSRDAIENALQEAGQEYLQGRITGVSREAEQLLRAAALGATASGVTTTLASGAQRAASRRAVETGVTNAPPAGAGEIGPGGQRRQPADRRTVYEEGKDFYLEELRENSIISVPEYARLAREKGATEQEVQTALEARGMSSAVAGTTPVGHAESLRGEGPVRDTGVESYLDEPSTKGNRLLRVVNERRGSNEPQGQPGPPPPDTVRLYRADRPDALEAQGKGWSTSLDYVSQKYGAGAGAGTESIWYIDVPKKTLDDTFGDWRSIGITDTQALQASGIDVQPRLYRRINEPQIQTKPPVEAQRAEAESGRDRPSVVRSGNDATALGPNETFPTTRVVDVPAERSTTKPTGDRQGVESPTTQGDAVPEPPARFYHRDSSEVVEVSQNQRRINDPDKRVRVVLPNGREKVVARDTLVDPDAHYSNFQERNEAGEFSGPPKKPVKRVGEVEVEESRRYYHGTGQEFNTFSQGAPKTTGGGLNRYGFFFSPERKVAERYAKDFFGEKGVVKEVELDYKNPLKLMAGEFEQVQSMVGKIDRGEKLSEVQEVFLEGYLEQAGWRSESGVHPIEWVKSRGFDAIEKAAGRGGAEPEVMVFRPEQVRFTESPKSEAGLPPSTTAAKRASMSADRAALDLPELPPAERKSWQRSLSEARPETATRLADEVLNRPRVLNDSETASLVVRAQQVKNEHAAKLKEIADTADDAAIQSRRGELEALEREFDQLTQAAKASGTEKGRALAAQKLTINQDYDLVSLVARFKASAGREPTVKERTRIEELSRRNAELEAKLAEANDRLANQRIQQEIDRTHRRSTRTETKAQIDAEWTDLTKQFAEIRQREASFFKDESGTFDPEAVKLIARMVRNRVRAGVVNAAQLVDEIHAIVGGDKRELRDTISSYRTQPAKQQSDLQRQLNALKSELRQLSSAEDVAAGRRAPRQEGPQGEFRRDLARQRALQKQIADLEGQIASGQFRERATPEPPRYTAETLRLQKQLEDVRMEYERMKYRATASITTRLGHEAVKAINSVKTLKSIGDISAVFRQGGFYALSHPLEGLLKPSKAMLDSFTELGYRNVEAAIKADPAYDTLRRAGVEFTGVDPRHPHLSLREEGFLGGEYLDYIPGLKQVKNFSERTFVSFLDAQRLSMGKQMLDALTPEQRANPKELKAIAKLINAGTGRGNLGARGNSAAPVLNLGIFSPRLLVSRIQLLNNMISPRKLATMPPGARKRMIADNVKFLAATTLILGLAKAAGADINLDPDDSDFLKIRAGNTTYDTLAGLQQPLRYFVSMGRAIKADITGDETYAGQSKGELTGRFARSKLSPSTGTALDYVTGKDFMGRKFSAGRAAKELVMPLPAKDIVEAMQKEGLWGGAKATPTFVGIGVGNYPPPAERAGTHAEKLARRMVIRRLPDEARTQEEIDIDTKRSELRARSRRGEDVSADIQALGPEITDRQAKAILAARNRTRLQEDVNRLGIKDALLVYSVANSQQRAELKDLLTRKADLVATLPPDEQAAVTQKLNEYGLSGRGVRISRPSREFRQSRQSR